MAEILIKAVDAINTDPEQDRRGSYKRGMPIVVMPDGHLWGDEECMPKFAVLKIPGVSVDAVQKYVQTHQIQNGVKQDGLTPRIEIYRRRLWQLRWVDLPAAARNKLISTGVLTIKAGAYNGTYDYTWAQVKQYFRNLDTGLDETGDL